MTAEDKEELRGLLNDHSIVLSAKFQAGHEILKYQLDAIEITLSEVRTQTLKTNGRVTELEKKNITHYVECPNVMKIQNMSELIEKDIAVNSYKKEKISMFWVKAGVIAAVSIGVVTIIFEVVKK
jgi:hypothetical protein